MELKLVLWIAVCGVVLHAGVDMVPLGEGFRPLLLPLSGGSRQNVGFCWEAGRFAALSRKPPAVRFSFYFLFWNLKIW